MAHIFRLIRCFLWFVVGLLIAIWSTFSIAGDVACPSFFASFSPDFCRIQSDPPPCLAPGNCRSVVAGDGYVGYQWVSSCNSPNVRNSLGQCVPPPCTFGESGGGNYFSGCYDIDGKDNGCDVGQEAMPPQEVCDGSCWVSNKEIINCMFPVGGGPIVCNVSGSKVGESCTSADIPQIPPNSQRCPTGYLVGYINGKAGCYKSGPSTASTSSTTTSTSGDTTTKTTTTVNTTNNTTTTTTTTTNNVTGETSITSANTPTDASKPIGSGEEDINNENDCQKNPTSPLCKKSSFSGGCGSFSCDGDAIQCAIAREQHQRNCALYDTGTSLSDLGNQLSTGTDSGVTSNPANAANRQIINLPSVLDITKTISASCLDDLTVQVMTSSITVPFSSLCPYLEIMGQIVIAFSLMAAAKIVSGGIL